jgi:uridine kinase
MHLVIGIAGGSGSGKTTVVKKVLSLFDKNDVVLLSQDNYYKDNSHLDAQARKSINFDHPESIEFSLLSRHIQDLVDGKNIIQPSYSYLTCGRGEGKDVRSKSVIVVEGILLFTDPDICKLFDVKIFVDALADERLIRLIRRDTIERGRDAKEVLDRYEKTVRPMHDQFIEPSKRYADIIIPQGGHNHVAIKVVSALIKNKLRDNPSEKKH